MSASLSFSVILVITSSLMANTHAAKNCRDCTKAVFDVLKNEPYFKQRVYQVEKEYDDAHAQCKAKDLFSYYDFTGQCHNCKELCSDPASKLECIRICQPYLLFLNFSSEIDKLKQDLAVKDKHISRLQTEVVVSHGCFAFLFFFMIFLQIVHFIYNTWTYCRKLPIVKPTSDAKAEAQPLTQVTTPHQETNRSDPDDSSYESNVSLSQWAI